MQASYGENTHEVCIPSTVVKRGQYLIVPCLGPQERKSHLAIKQSCGNLLAVRKVSVPESFVLLN